MREDFAFTCVRDALDAPNVRLAGFHMHIGSQIFALHSFGEAIDVIVEFAHRVKETYGYEIDEIDVGGGLGIAYTAEDKPSSIEDFAEITTSEMIKACKSMAERTSIDLRTGSFFSGNTRSDALYGRHLKNTTRYS